MYQSLFSSSCLLTPSSCSVFYIVVMPAESFRNNLTLDVKLSQRIWWNRFLVKLIPRALSHKAVWALYAVMGKIKWWPCVFPECWVWSCSAQPGGCQAFDKCFPPCACRWASPVPADPNVSVPCSLADVFGEQLSVLTAFLYECQMHPSVENRW